MLVINDSTVVVSTFLELKDVLENNNDYEYIYINANFITSDNIDILSTKKNITIDGSYQSNMITLINYDYKINVGSNNNLVVKNINLINSNANGFFFAPNDRAYLETNIKFINISLNGTSLANALRSNITLIDGTIMLSKANEVLPTYLFQGGSIYVGGLTYIDSASSSNPVFSYNAGFPSPKLYFLPNSDITITIDTKELMGGTTKLDFKVLHGAKVNLTAGNGFNPAPVQGCLDVLIDTCATFNFLENSHSRVPMWTIYNSLTILDNATLSVINNADTAPSDNYNIHFKGTSPSIYISNPKSVIFYTKNSNVLYADNTLNFNFHITRINMWNNSSELSSFGTINTLPDYAWYNSDVFTEISGTINKMDTTVLEHNLTDVSNFSFLNKKVFSIGNSTFNVYPINNSSTSISGYAQNDSDILIKYNNNSYNVTVDDTGFYTHNLTNNIVDGTDITITSCIPGSFIYEQKIITTPFTGELTLMSAPEELSFNLTPISVDPYVFPRNKEFHIKAVDSREVGSDFKIMANLSNNLKTSDNIKLDGAIVFKSFDNQITVLSTNKTAVLRAKNNEGIPKVYDHTLSSEKGILLYLDNKYLEINKEYSTNIIWSLQK